MEVSDTFILNPAQLLTKQERKKKEKASTENSVLDLSKLLYPLSLYFVLAQMESVSDVTSKKNQEYLPVSSTELHTVTLRHGTMPWSLLISVYAYNSMHYNARDETVS